MEPGRSACTPATSLASSGLMKRPSRVGRRRFLGVLGTSGLGGLLAGCPRNSGGPNPVPTPAPTPSGTPTNLPRGIANATMLQNLGLVTALAQQYRPGSFWVRAVGDPTLSGTPRFGQAWNYAFFSRTPSRSTLDIWEVFSDGETRVLWDVNQPTPYDLADIRSIAWLDSPQAMSAALVRGLDRCTASRPNEEWRITASYEQRSGFPGISIQLNDSVNSFQGRVLLSPTDGQLISQEIRC